MRRHNDVPNGVSMERLGVIGSIAIVITLALLLAAWLLGARMQMTKVIELCEKGGKFYRLDANGDVPFRCTRVIDLPPSTTQGSSNVPPETNR